MKSSMRLYGLFCAALLPVMMCLSCNKLISDLIPPDEQKLISLDLRNVERYVCSTNTAIRDHSVTVTVPKGTDVTRLLPEAVVSAQATLFPVTLRYLQEAFPATDVLKIGSAIGSFENIEAINKWFFEMYAENPNFTIPELIFPINFLSPVPFAVIGGQGRIELYTVKVLYDDGTDPATGTLPEGVPAEKNILSFSVGEPQIGESVIGAKTVDFEVKAGTEVRALTVQATVSPHAVLIPLTEPYLVPLLRNLGMDPLSVLSGYITAPNKEAYLRALFAPVNLSSVTVPLNKPIDFTNPVQFAVLGNDKDVKLYTARCKQTVTGAVLKNFGFSKVKNSALVKDGTVRIDRAAKTVTAELLYPVEYTGSGSFSLYCDVAYAGDAALIEYKGTRYNAADTIPFTPENPSGAQYHLGSAEAKIIISFGTEQTEYRLFISFKEDPDTVRSITDFRFTKDKNSELKTLSMAAIANDGHEGTITATVLYTGSAKPESLIPTFITPGTVTVNGAAQTSGSSAQDFRRTLAYICTSRDGQYRRTYTVKIRFVYAEPAQSLLKTFRFPAGVNPLTKDSEGRIDQTAHTVHISAHYAGERPKKLIPEFSATGEVTVDALTQSSGFSAQDFEYPVYYKVTDPGDPSAYTIYAVTVHFEYSADSGCELMEFKLLMQDNPSLTQDVTAFISAHSGVIYALLPRGADAANLIPRFTARGRVTVDGVEQTSGETAADFSAPVEYKVTSENGLQTKTYRVTLQQAGGIIYVDPKATGRGNGSTWQDAFTSLEAALHKANEMPAEVSAELWLSKDCTLNNKQYELKRTLTLRGGFDGIEYEADQRNKDNKSVFNTVNFSSQTALSGTLTFDGIEFRAEVGDSDIIKQIQWDIAAGNNALVIQNCLLSGAFSVETSARLTSVTVKDTVIADTERIYRKSALKLQCDTAHIENCTIPDDYWDYSNGCGSMEVNRLIFDVNRESGPAQSVTVKNCRFAQYWAQRFTAQTVTVERVTAQAESWYISKAKNVRLTHFINPKGNFNYSHASERGIYLYDCDSTAVSIEDSEMAFVVAYEWHHDAVSKLKSITVVDSSIDYLIGDKAITESLSWKNSRKYEDHHFGNVLPTGRWIRFPACSVTLERLNHAEKIDTLCYARFFRSVMEARPVYTDIKNVKAERIYCGYADGSSDSYNNTAYTLGGHSVSYPSLCCRLYEEKDFKTQGTQNLDRISAKYLTVLSGDSITVNNRYFYHNYWDNETSYENVEEFRYRTSQHNQSYISPDCNCYIRNEKTENSTVTLSSPSAWRKWIRVITNSVTLHGRSMDDYTPMPGDPQFNDPSEAHPSGIVELYGYQNVTLKGKFFFGLTGARYGNGLRDFLPAFVAVGANIQTDGIAHFHNSLNVLTGTVFDTLRNNTYPCTVAVKK